MHMIQTLNFFLKEKKKKKEKTQNLYVLILLYHVMVYSSAVERPSENSIKARGGSAAISLKKIK